MRYPAKFIAATKKYSTFENHIAAPCLRRSFILEKKPETAEILICGLGFYELYLNGKNVTKGALAPYISAIDDYVYYDSYDVAPYLTEGENVIGVVLGNGMQNVLDGQIWDLHLAKWRGAPRLALRFEAKNGEEVFELESDESFRCAPSPTFFDSMRCGEYYDARMEQEGWCEARFDDSAWEYAFVTESPRGKPQLCTVEPIVAEREIKPVAVTKQGDQFLYDFGENCAGVCRLTINGKAGQKISMEHGEWLDNGRLNLSNIRFVPEGYTQKDIYICSGKGRETHTPRFTYHGFQYVLVSGITEEQANEELLTYVVMHSDLRERGGFSCSDPVANRLQDAVRRSTLANFYYFPTDCPQREKNGWTGDAAVSCEHTLLNLEAENSYAEWLRGIRTAQSEEGKLPGIVPTGGWGYDWGNGPAWDCALTVIPYYIYLYRGDKKILEENATGIFRYLNYISKIRTPEGLVEAGLGDWCPPGRHYADYKAPVLFTDSVICMDICKKAAYIFDELGLVLQKEFAVKLADSLRQSIRERLIDFATMTAEGNCQTSQAMAIYYGVFEKGESIFAFHRLLRQIEEQNNSMDTGILGCRVIFHVLSAFGKSDLAYQMITKPEFPSFGNLLQRGATTLWEFFQPEGGEVGSLNHHFFGDISGWFIKTIAGIELNPYGKNVNEIRIRPHLIEKLNFAEGFHIAPAGKIGVCWKREKDRVKLTVTVPDGMTGKVEADPYHVFENGRSCVKIEKSGTHTFVLCKAG